MSAESAEDFAGPCALNRLSDLAVGFGDCGLKTLNPKPLGFWDLGLGGFRRSHRRPRVGFKRGGFYGGDLVCVLDP